MIDVLYTMLGFFMGVLFVFVLVVLFPTTPHLQAKKAVAQCEKSLPRDQHCVITAEPAKP